MKNYTLGFIFDPTMARVVLMQKNRPDWQKGKLNGIGGKIEEGESDIAAMVREALEEAGLATSVSDWTHVALLKGSDWRMEVYGLAFAGPADAVRTTTDEQVTWYEVARLPENLLSNVPWLIQLSIDKLKNKEFKECVVTYP